MRRLVSLLSRFRDDQSGVFAIIFALMAIVLVALGGAVVDYVQVQQARTRTQVALDSAALALQPQIFVSGVTNEQLRAKAELLLLERLRADGTWSTCPSADDSVPCAKVDTATMNVSSGSLNLTSSVTVPTSFVSLVGVPKLEATIISEATRKKLNLEVAFVLDNSNSMSNSSRMTNLIAATKCAANILLNEDCASTATTTSVANTKLAIVPFTMLVNVGTNNANATWMDRKGYDASTGTLLSDITHDNFDNDDNQNTAFQAQFDRIALFSQLKNASWGGCVEARVYPYDTNDTPPSPAVKNTLFTPFFAPDEPGPAAAPGRPNALGFYNSYLPDSPSACKQEPTCVYKQVKTNCNKAGSNAYNYSNASCSGGTSESYTYTSETGAVSNPSSCPATAYNHAGTYRDSYSSSGWSSYTNTWTRTWTYAFTDRELQERLCKYTNATVNAFSQSSAHGPNTDCPVNAITPLTATKSTITAAINALDPQGGTNIHAGTEWGFHVLSPGEPFTEGSDYASGTSKVMVIMTDGENTAYQGNTMNNSIFYSYYGYPWNARMGTATSTNAQLVAEMNKRTKETCANAKAAGITIYTVGLSVDQTSDPTTNTQMLKDCSSGSGYWFFPTASSELVDVFKTIAGQLAALRLAK